MFRLKFTDFTYNEVVVLQGETPSGTLSDKR